LFIQQKGSEHPSMPNIVFGYFHTGVNVKRTHAFEEAESNGPCSVHALISISLTLIYLMHPGNRKTPLQT
jgi:hypothetical protein